MRPLHAIGIAFAFLALASAGPLLVGQESGSVLGRDLTGGPAVDRAMTPGDLARFEASGYTARFAFTRPVPLDPATDALVLVAPTVGFTAEEVNLLLRFLRAGGHVLLADTGGAGGELLERLGAGITLGDGRVYSPAFNESPRRLVGLATDVVPGLPREVTLTRPTLVEGGRPVIQAPTLAWVDENGNGRPDVQETLAPSLALAAVANVGEGRLLVVGHPDAVNTLAYPELSRALLAFLTEDGARVLVFDEAHRARADPFSVNGFLAGRTSAIAGTGMLMFTFVLGAVVVLAPRVSREGARKRARWNARTVHPAVLAEMLEELDRK